MKYNVLAECNDIKFCEDKEMIAKCSYELVSKILKTQSTDSESVANSSLSSIEISLLSLYISEQFSLSFDVFYIYIVIIQDMIMNSHNTSTDYKFDAIRVAISR